LWVAIYMCRRNERCGGDLLVSRTGKVLIYKINEGMNMQRVSEHREQRKDSDDEE